MSISAVASADRDPALCLFTLPEIGIRSRLLPRGGLSSFGPIDEVFRAAILAIDTADASSLASA